MLLERYESQSLLCNQSVKGATAKSGQFAFRGDLVIEEGEIADAQGRRKPPKSVVKQAVMLLSADRILGIAGEIHELALLSAFAEKYTADIDPALPVLFYVSNLAKPLQLEWSGAAK